MKLSDIKPTRAGLNKAIAAFYELHSKELPSGNISSESYWEPVGKQTPGEPWTDAKRVKHFFFDAPSVETRPMLEKYLAGLGFIVNQGYGKGGRTVSCKLPT